MKALLVLLVSCLPLVARADDAPAGGDLIDRGAQMLLQGLIDQMTPALRDLGRQLGDLSDYRLPEVLPNGDIIIRRKVPIVPGAPGRPLDL